MTLKVGLRRLLSVAMISVGVMHFTHEPIFTAIVPPWLPAPRVLVFISGLCEIAGGVGLEFQRTRRAAAWGLLALYIAVFPANIHMAINDVPLNGESLGAGRFVRLPFQFLFMAWAWWFTRPDPPPELKSPNQGP